MSDSGSHLQLAAALRRRLSVIAITTGTGALIAYWAAMALPNYYESTVTIFVATQEIDRRLAEAGSAPFDLGVRLRSMTSRVLGREQLSALIEAVRLDAPPSESSALPDGRASQEGITRLRSRVRVAPVASQIGPGGSLERVVPDRFRIGFTDRDPRLAAEVAERLAAAYVEEYVDERLALSRMRLEAIEREFSRRSDLHRAVEAEIAAFRMANASRLPEERATNQWRLDQTLDALRRAQRTRDRARSSLAHWEAEALATVAPSEEPAEDLGPEQRREQLELQIAEFRSRGFTDRHPGVIRVKRELLAFRSQIEAGGGAGEERRSGARPDAEAQRRMALEEFERSRDEARKLGARVELFEQRLAASAGAAESLIALNEASKQKSEVLANLADRRLQASLHVDAERRQLGEEFRIVESAVPATEPSSPDRLRILLAGLFAGLLCGIAVAVVAELHDSSFRSVRDLRRAFELPVLGEIPDIVVEADRVARRRRSLRNAVAACLFAAFGLASGALAYVYVNGAPDWLTARIEARANDVSSGAERPKPISGSASAREVEATTRSCTSRRTISRMRPSPSASSCTAARPSSS
jgi:succinoglycan biosynthesis transport protein ExoP